MPSLPNIDAEDGQGYCLSHDKRVRIIADHIAGLSDGQKFVVREAVKDLAELIYEIPMTSAQHTKMFGIMNILRILHPNDTQGLALDAKDGF